MNIRKILASTAPVRHHLDKRAHKLIEQGAGNPDDLLSTPEVAEWFGCSEQWLEIGRSKGYGPPFVQLALRLIRYRRGSCLKYLLEREHASQRKAVGS